MVIRCCETGIILNGHGAYRHRDSGDLYSIESPTAENLYMFEDGYVYDLSDEEFLLDDDYSDLDWYDLVTITTEGIIND